MLMYLHSVDYIPVNYKANFKLNVSPSTLNKAIRLYWCICQENFREERQKLYYNG